jgi:hypothetical protein
LGIDQELLKKEFHKKEVKIRPKTISEKQNDKFQVNPLEINLIRLLLEYPQKTAQTESEKVLDLFLQPELKILGGKIVEAYKLLGFVDINIILSADEDKPLLETINRLMMETLPADDNTLEKNFADNIRQIRKKWYKEQRRQVQFKLSQAQESGDKELTQQLTCQKQDLMKEEKELR